MPNPLPDADAPAAAVASAVASSTWGRPETVFAIVAVFMGAVLTFVTPPFQVPDEPAHLFRVWQLSYGKVVVPHYMTTVPVEFGDLLHDAGQVTHTATPSVPARAAFAGLRAPRLCGRTQDFQIYNTALYSPVPYLPQILGVLVARKLHWPTVAILDAGRVAAAIGYAVLGWLAIRVTPVLKWPAAATLAAPMALFMAASVSADPITTVTAYVATAFGLRMILAPGPVPVATVVGLGVSTVALTLCKSAYFPVAGLMLLVPRRNWPGRRPWVAPVVIGGLLLVALLGWSALSKPLGVREAGGDPAQQFHYVLGHPFRFLVNVGRTMVEQSNFLYRSGLGGMGWLDTWMPELWMAGFTCAVLWIVVDYDEPVDVPPALRLAAGGILVASTAMIVLANYLVWTPTAAQRTEGLQGRYFLPLALPCLLLFRRRGRDRPSPVWIGAGLIGSNLLACWYLIDRFYIL